MQESGIPAQFLKSIPFQRAWNRLPAEIQRKCLDKLHILAKNPRHPSLHIHPVRCMQDPTWICYLSKQYRLLFQYTENGEILLLTIGSHTIVDQIHKDKYRSPRLRKRARWRSR
jgi:mRNA-degrading endonuclease RelE of RelBE toxin-antitoxin system